LITLTIFAVIPYLFNYNAEVAFIFAAVGVAALLCFFFYFSRLLFTKKRIGFPSFWLGIYLFLLLVANLYLLLLPNLVLSNILIYELNIFYKVSSIFIFYSLLWLFTYCLGLKILKKLRIEKQIQEPEKHFISLGLGFIPLIFGIFLILALKILYAWVVGGFVFLLALWVFPELKTSLSRLWSLKIKNNLDRNNKAMILFVLFVLCLAFVYIIKPIPYGTDDLSAYFNGPNIFINQHQYQVLEQHIRANWSQNTEMIYTGIMSLLGSPFAVHFQFFSFILLLVGVYCFMKNFWGRSYALAGLLIVLTIPWNKYYFNKFKVEFFLSFYCLLLVYSAFLYIYKQKPYSHYYLYLFGVFAGLALGIKYNAFFLILPLGLLIIFAKIKNNTPKAQVLKNLVGAGLLGLIFFSPWLIKNQIYFSNPTHPWQTVFGTSDYSSFEVLKTKPKWKKIRGNELNEIRHSINEKSKVSISGMVQTLWSQSVGNKIDTGLWVNFGFIPILILPFYFLYRKQRTRSAFILIGLGQFILWFFLAGARTWYNFFGIITLYMALSFLVVDYRKFGYLYIFTAITIFFCFFHGLDLNLNTKYLIGELDRQEYREKVIPYNGLAKYINNQNWEEDDKILMAGIYPTAFIENNHKITMVDKYYIRIGSHIHQGDQNFLRSLKKASIAYIVRSKNKPYVNWIKKKGFAGKEEYLAQYNRAIPSIYEDIDKLDSFLKKHASLEYKTPNDLFYLYKINYHGSE